MRNLVAVAAVAAALAMTGCGGSDKEVSPAQAAFEDAEVVRVGRAALLQLEPGTQDREARRILAFITDGKWVENGLIIPPQKIDGLCEAHIMSAESCDSLGR